MWVHAQLFSHVWLFATSWTITSQVPLSMEFSSQEYRSGLLFPASGESSWHRVEPVSCIFSTDRQIHYQLHHLGSCIYNSVCLCLCLSALNYFWCFLSIIQGSISKCFLLQSITFRTHINKFSDAELLLHPGDKPFLVLFSFFFFFNLHFCLWVVSL